MLVPDEDAAEELSKGYLYKKVWREDLPPGEDYQAAEGDNGGVEQLKYAPSELSEPYRGLGQGYRPPRELRAEDYKDCIVRLVLKDFVEGRTPDGKSTSLVALSVVLQSTSPTTRFSHATLNISLLLPAALSYIPIRSQPIQW